jgi:hypothetical protein
MNLLLIPFISCDYNDGSVHFSSNEPHSILADISGVSITWTSRRNLQATPIEHGDRIAGDHILVKAEWQPEKLVNWTYLSINASAIPALLEEETNSNIAEIDTRYLGNNATCIINATIGLDNGTIISKIIDNVFLGNFFTPSIAVLSPNGGEVWIGVETIIWQAWDLNVEEHLTYEVLLSSDSDKSPQLLSSGLTQTLLDWDFSGLVNISTYKVKVRVSDGIYRSSDDSDDFFTAGLIHPTTTSITSTNITTTTTTMTYDIRVVGFLIALMASSVLIALVAYFRAKKL